MDINVTRIVIEIVNKTVIVLSRESFYRAPLCGRREKGDGKGGFNINYTSFSVGSTVTALPCILVSIRKSARTPRAR